MTQLTQAVPQTVHVRFEGRSEELSLDTLNLNRNSLSDANIKRAVARFFDRPTTYFNNYAIVRTSQAIIVRPEAIYG